MPQAQQVIQRLQTLRPFFALLVGLPASGKSTFTKLAKESIDITVISTDNMIDEWAAANGMTYSQAWDKCPMKEFNKRFQEEIDQAVAEQKNIFIDRTNMSSKSRKSLVSKSSIGHTNVAIKFDVPDKVLQERLASRAAATGKFIPQHVIKSMTDAYMPPSKAEGFKYIIELVQ